MNEEKTTGPFVTNYMMEKLSWEESDDKKLVQETVNSLLILSIMWFWLFK